MADRSLTLGTLFTANATQFMTTVTAMQKKVGKLNATMMSVGSKGAKGMNAAATSMNKVGKSMDGASKKADKTKKSLRGVAGAFDRIKTAAKITSAFAAAAAVISGVVTAFREGAKEIVEYDQGLKNLQAITNATNQEVAGMGETIKDVARTTKFSTGEVAAGMTLLGQAGFSATESIQAMKSVAELATGTLSSMQFTADLMTTTIRAFGMSTVESAKAADIMANAINRSKLTIDKLRIAFNFVGAASHQAGLSLEETAASMMVLANQGFRASTIGTGLRQVLARLLAPTGKLREEFEAANIELSAVNPSLVGFRQAMENLKPILVDQATGVVDMAKAYRLFGLRGAQAAAVMSAAVHSGNYDRMLELTYETGTAARMAAKQAEGLGLKLKNLADRARLVAVALGEAGLISGIGAVVDAFKMLATGVEQFIRSDLGGLITAFIGWTATIYLSITSLNLLITVVGKVGIWIGKLTKTVWALVAAQTAAAASGSGMQGALKLIAAIAGGSKGAILAFALALGLVVAGLRHWATAGERQIKALRKVQSETLTNVQTLKLHMGVLDSLAKKEKAGANIKAEHSRLIRRMRSDLEKLKPALRDEAKYLKLNKEALEGLFNAQLNQAILQQVELIKRSSEEVESSSIMYGLLNIVWGELTAAGNLIINALVGIKDGFIAIATFVPKMMDEWIRNSELLSKTYGGMLNTLGDWWKGVEDFYSSWVSSHGKGAAKVKAKQAEVNNEFLELVRLTKLKSGGKLPLEDAIKQAEKLYETLTGKDMVVTPDLFNQIQAQIGDIHLKLKEEQAKWQADIDELPESFREMYKKMDGLRKADFAKALKSMQSELAAFEKSRDQMDLTDQEYYEGRSAIKARHLAKFAATTKKETEITKEAADEQFAMLQIQEEATKELYHKRTVSLINFYMKQKELVKGNKEKDLQVEKDFNAEVKKQRERLDGELRQLEIKRSATTVQLQKQTMEKVKDLHKKIMEDLKKQLKSLYDDIKSERDGFLDDLKSLDESYEDTVRGLRQNSMTDEQKWLDDRQHLHKVMNEASVKGDVEMYEKAAQLAKELAREVQDENGNVVRTIENTSTLAEDLITQIHTAHTSLIKREVADREHQMRKLKDEIKSVDEQVKEFAKTIDWLNTKKLAIKADETIKDLSEVYKINHSFKEEWDALHSKTITLTVKYNYVGKKSGSGGSEESTGEGGGKTASGSDSGGGEDTGARYGGLIQRMLAFGGKLAGYGGGDKVRARLEPGEYVIRKEAVKKYGGRIFDNLNKMRVPDVASSVGKRLGGMIGDTIRNFRAGGLAPAPAMKANQQVFNITIRPKYLTGDRQAMRSMAKDVSKAVEEQAKRWGRK